jgi:hypothetical protein
MQHVKAQSLDHVPVRRMCKHHKWPASDCRELDTKYIILAAWYSKALVAVADSNAAAAGPLATQATAWTALRGKGPQTNWRPKVSNPHKAITKVQKQPAAQSQKCARSLQPAADEAALLVKESVPLEDAAAALRHCSQLGHHR